MRRGFVEPRVEEQAQGKAFVGGEADLLVGEVEVELGEEQPPHLLRVLGRTADLVVVPSCDARQNEGEVESIVDRPKRRRPRMQRMPTDTAKTPRTRATSALALDDAHC